MRVLRVYNESAHGKQPVGRLWSDGNEWCFQYEAEWLKGEFALRLGPDLPLRAEVQRSKTVFLSFLDRLPSKANPAYPEYCRMWGISSNERDPIRLLSTLAHRGPSSFVFEEECIEALTAAA